MKALKKIGKVIGIMLLVLIILLAVTLTVTSIVYHIKLTKIEKQLQEEEYYNPVSVGDHSLNLYSCGSVNGRHTIVALAGWGDGEMSIGWRMMTADVEKDNRVIFLDRAGYGLSDDTDQDMNVETVVEEYRTALKTAGIEAPYLLMGHSMGGIYATYWESKYPDEIEAVIFVDGEECHDIPEEIHGSPEFMTMIIPAIEKLGLAPLLIRIEYGKYTDKLPKKEREQAIYLMCRTLRSRAALNEMTLDDRNVDFAWNEMVTNDIPKLYITASLGFHSKDEFINNGITAESLLGAWAEPSLKSAGDDAIYADALKTMEECRTDLFDPYFEKLGNCKTVEIPGDHVIYFHKPDECCNIVSEFVNGLYS